MLSLLPLTRWQHVGVIYYVINVKFREGRGAYSTFPASLDSSGGVRAGYSAIVCGVADAWDSWYTKAQWIIRCIVHADYCTEYL